MSVRTRITYWGYRGVAASAPTLPETFSRVSARVVGRLSFYVFPNMRRLVQRHMVRASGRAVGSRALTKRAFASYAQYWIESFRTPSYSKSHFDATYKSDGQYHLDEALAAGKGAILGLPHVGDWDFGGAWLGHEGYPTTVVAEILEPRELFDFFVKQREAVGVEVIALDGQSGRATIEALRANRVLALMSDRDLVDNGVEVEFFGERTKVPLGPAMLALRTGAALIPTASYMDARGQHLAWFRPPVSVEREGKLRDDVVRVTQQLAKELEILISARPEQWHLFQPNWPSDRPAPPGAVSPPTVEPSQPQEKS